MNNKASLSAAGLLACTPGFVFAQAVPAPTQLPTGEKVVAGQAAISRSGAVMNVDQASQRAAIDWQTYNLGSDATIHYNQPSADSVTLNRVTDANASQIFGHITANGQVFLSNPNGVYFAPGASVNVGGLVATTHTISLEDFLSGNTRLERNGARGSVVNRGELRAALGGYIALLAPEVRNEGLVLANLGTVGLAAGDRIELQFDANKTLAGLSVSPSTIRTLVENRSAVLAPGGLIILSARAVAAVQGSVVNSGEIRAASLVDKGGRILLEGDNVELQSGSILSATGATGGGEILVGGDWQGGGAMHQATRVAMDRSASIDASATGEGDGGKVVLWSDVNNATSSTEVRGAIAARGAGNGTGGQVETSGHSVVTDGARIDAGAPRGKGGLWLLDPYDYTIDGSAAGTINTTLNAGTNVTIDTVNNGGPGAGASSNGDINVTAPITKTTGGDATLTLKAARHITLQSGATVASSSNRLNLLLWADSDNSGDGIIQSASTSLNTNGGWLKFGNNQTATINGLLTPVGGDVFMNGTSAQSITTAGGAVDIYGEVIIGNTSGLSINTGGGNVGVHGVVNSGNQYNWVDKTADTAHDWTWARTAAINGTGGRSAIGDSYLVTITSRLENAIAGLTAGYRGAWIGAYRANPGSSYAWTWADGPESGVNFFTQSSGGGGAPVAGYYANFGSGEPNGALNASGENVGQFFGTGGQWNDLTAVTQFSASQGSQYAVLGYVRETNTATSPLSINAGSGTVTFDRAIGGSKALASLDVSAGLTAMNGGSLATEGAQAYHGAVQLGANTTLTTRNSDITFDSTVDSANPTVPNNLTINILPNTTYYWADWTSSTPTSVTGAITIGSNVINVTYNNPNGFAFAQTSGGTNYWTFTGGSSPYVSANVANGPTGSDLVALRYAGSQTLTFSQSVENLAFSIVSLNGNGYGYDQNFNIESYAGLNGAGNGYFGHGTLIKSVVGNTYQLNDAQLNSPSEPHGTIRFTGAFSNLTWQSLSNEYWNGFTVGVSGTSAGAGAVNFNGTAGGFGALGAVTVNGALRTSANINAAASLSVTGSSSLGGGIATSGNQSFGSAVNLSNDATLTTTNNGNVNFATTLDGAHALTVATNGSGDATFGGAVGGTSALTGLAVTTDVLSAGAIRLAAGAPLNIANGGASAITGIVAGSGTALTKTGSGTLTLSGANTYSGGTTVAAGVVRLGAATSGGITNGPVGTGLVTVDGGASLDLAGYSLSNALNLSGSGASGNGALFNSTSTTVTVSGDTTLSADTTIKSASGGGLNYNGSINGAHALTIDVQGGNLAINAPLTLSGGNTVTLSATGTITDGAGGYVSAANLLLLGGNVTLDSASNAVDVLAASGVGSLRYLNSGAVTLGSIGSTNGITTSGTINVGTVAGDLTIARNVSTTNASASALVLNAAEGTSAGTASGGNLLISGTPSISVGSGGTGRLYTGSVAGSTGLATLLGAGSGVFRYNSDEVASNYSLALGAGLNAIYRERPVITFTADDKAVNYGTAPTNTLTVNSSNGDTVAQILTSSPSIVVGGATSTSGNYTVGGHSLSASGVGVDRLGYAVAGYTPGTLTVTAKALVYSGTASPRAYDGTTAATVIDSVSGGVLGDDLSVSSASTNFSVDGNAGTGKAIGVNGISLGGADMSNYSIAGTAAITGNITPRTVSLSGMKTYDGTTALGAGAVSVDTGVGSETLRYSGATSSDANVAASGKYINGITLLDAVDGSGGLALNYALPTLNTANAPVTINPAPLLITASNDAKFVTQNDSAGYHGALYSGFVNGETSAVLSGSLNIARNNAGTNAAGTYAGVLVPSGQTSTNYAMNYSSGDFRIVPAQELLVTVANTSGTYGTTPNYTVTSASYLNSGNVLQNLTLSGSSGNTYTFNDGLGGAATFTLAPAGAVSSGSGNVGAGTYSLIGTDTHIVGSNFAALNFVGGVVVNPKTVTASATGVTKVYDGTSSMTNVLIGLNGLETGDIVTANGNGNFSQRSVGSNLDYNISAIALSGPDHANYLLSGGASLQGSNGAITRLSSVSWTGGTTGNWFNPANWAGGAVPDLANVANVVIPAGVLVSFDTAGAVAPAQTGAVQIESLGTLGGLRQVDGSLVVGSGGVALGSFVQTGGSLAVGGDLSITNEFSQSTSGTIAVDGRAHLFDRTGGTTLGNLSARGGLSVRSTNGDIVQAAGTTIAVDGPTVLNAPGAQIRISTTDNQLAGGVSYGENLPVIVPPVLPPTGTVPARPISSPATLRQATLARASASPVAIDGRDSTTLKGESLLVSLVRESSRGEDGLIRVQAIQDAIDAGFTFKLPERMTANAPANTMLTATLGDGVALPTWLRFEPGTSTFAVSRPPEGGLPISVFVEFGGQRWLVIISRLDG